MIFFFIFNTKNDLIVFILHIFLYKRYFLKIFDNYQYIKVYTGTLIDVKDYYNLSFIISTSKNIYTGYIPALESIASQDIYSINNAITFNKNYVLISCPFKNFVSKMNIKTGKVTNLEINFHYYESLSVKTCPISLIGDKVYVIYSKKSGNLINWDFFELTLKDLENIDGPNIVGGFYLYYSMNSEPICYEKQIACETISISNENGIYLVCLYVKPEKQKDNNETIYNIYGFVEKKTFLFLILF